MFNIEKRKLYVGCSLTHAPESFRNDVEHVKETLSKDWEVMQFLGLTAGTAADVYNYDIRNNVATCGAFLAIVDLPSLGLGYEIGAAVERYNKPILLTAHRDAKVSRLIIGITEEHPTVSFAPYENMLTDVPMLVRQYL